MFVLLCMLLMAVSCLTAQNPSVAYKVLSDATTAVSSSTLRNQGQTNHIVNYTYTNSGGTCTPAAGLGYVQLESSFDSTNWRAITLSPSALTPITGGFQGQLLATGLYPFFRIRLTNNAPSNCVVNVWYSGSAYSVVYPQLLQALGGANYLINNASATPSTGTTNAILSTNLDSTKRYVVYGSIISNLNTANSLLILITDQSSGCPGTGTITIFQSINVPAGGTVVLPTSSIPYFIGVAVSNTLCGTFTGTTPSYSIQTVYRLEQ